eukprot:1039054-Ditylum_brightwellii.AAC.1
MFIIVSELLSDAKEEKCSSNETTGKDYVPSPADLLLKTKTETSSSKMVFNRTIKQCSMYSFVEACNDMSSIMKSVRANLHIVKIQKRNRDDLDMASNILSSIKNMEHNKKSVSKCSKLGRDNTEARANMNKFLNEVSNSTRN